MMSLPNHKAFWAVCEGQLVHLTFHERIDRVYCDKGNVNEAWKVHRFGPGLFDARPATYSPTEVRKWFLDQGHTVRTARSDPRVRQYEIELSDNELFAAMLRFR
jgi:hypothetical protein